MKKIFILGCYHLGIWGFLGFVVTLILGFISCCTGLSKSFFTYFLIGFGLLGIVVSTICIFKNCKKSNLDSH